MANVVGFWALGLPAGAWLAFRGGAGPRGLWWGLVLGLAATGLVNAARVRVKLRGAVARVAA